MKIAVIGAVCFDEILGLDGTRHESYGGILYNVAALAGLAGPEDAVVPVSNVGADHFDRVAHVFAQLPRVDASQLVCTPHPLTHVVLRWTSRNHRDEAIRHAMPPVDLARLEPVLDADAVHVNFINGTEIGLDALAAFRGRYQGLISLDVHQIISRFDPSGQRHIVGFPQWRQWAPHVDVLQCNEFELGTMLDGAWHTPAGYAAAARKICAAGPHAAVVTLGEDGAVLAHRVGERFFWLHLPAVALEPDAELDTTGCGDSFSAGFIMGMLRHANPVAAAACGVLAAAVNARTRGIAPLTEARAFIERPMRHVPELADKPPGWPGHPF